MPTRTATKKTEPKSQAKSQDSQKLGFQAEATPLPTDEFLARHQAQQDELQQPGRASKHDGEQLDNDPGYSKDQLDHMREYWGIKGDVTEPGA